jgi:hypothetical protein
MLHHFNYKSGEDFTCALCGKIKHTYGPRPDKLCDGCWELKHRIEDQPELARKVLDTMDICHCGHSKEKHGLYGNDIQHKKCTLCSCENFKDGK